MSGARVEVTALELATLAVAIQAAYIGATDPHQPVPGTDESVGLALGFLDSASKALADRAAPPEGR